MFLILVSPSIEFSDGRGNQGPFFLQGPENKTGCITLERVRSTVRQLTNGQPLLGGMIKEFDLKLTDTGKVTATITVTPPQPGAKPKATRIQFDIK
jgi:hypothetical protein